MAESYYKMISREVEKRTRPARAAARRYKRAFSQFNVFGSAAKGMSEADTVYKRRKPNYGKK